MLNVWEPMRILRSEGMLPAHISTWAGRGCPGSPRSPILFIHSREDISCLFVVDRGSSGASEILFNNASRRRPYPVHVVLLISSRGEIIWLMPPKGGTHRTSCLMRHSYWPHRLFGGICVQRPGIPSPGGPGRLPTGNVLSVRRPADAALLDLLMTPDCHVKILAALLRIPRPQPRQPS